MKARLSPAEVQAATRPIATARGLPNRAYTAAEWAVIEREELFSPTWACLGFVDGLTFVVEEGFRLGSQQVCDRAHDRHSVIDVVDTAPCPDHTAGSLGMEGISPMGRGYGPGVASGFQVG